MSPPESLSMEAFRVLVERAGMALTAEELEELKPLYDHYAANAASLHERDLGPKDMAVACSPETGLAD